MAAMPGRDGPTSSGASFRLDHGGKRGEGSRAPVKAGST